MTKINWGRPKDESKPASKIRAFLGRCNICREDIYEGFHCGQVDLFGCLLRRILDARAEKDKNEKDT